MDAEERAREGALLERAYLERLSKPERDELLAAIVAAAPTVEEVAGHEAEVIEQTVEAVRAIFGLIDTVELREAELAEARQARDAAEAKREAAGNAWATVVVLRSALQRIVGTEPLADERGACAYCGANLHERTNPIASHAANCAWAWGRAVVAGTEPEGA